jgi:hypothetical protein
MDASYYNLREFSVEDLNLLLSSDLTFTGENFFARLKLDNLTTGQATFAKAPATLEQQVNIPKNHLVTKEYIDSVDINGGKDFFLNYSNTDPLYTLYKILSPTIDLATQTAVQVLALGTNMLAQFLSPELNVSRIQAGLFTLNQYGMRTGSQGTVQFYFQVYLFSTNTLVGTSGLSNNVSNSVDLFTMVFNLTSNIEILPTERLVLKLYSVGISSSFSVVSALFEGEYYSFLTTTLSRTNDLLKTDNVWTGQNYYENPPNNPTEMATTDIIIFDMTGTSNTWTNDNYFLTKTSPNMSRSAATTAYCDNIVLSIYSSNNSWGTHLFTDETNLSLQLATCKYAVAKSFIPYRDTTFTGLNTFLSPTANSQEPANTLYVKNKFNGFTAQNNAFTGTQTWTSNPSTTNIATTAYMVDKFLNELTLGANVKSPTVTTSSTALATTAASRTIINGINATIFSANNALDTQEFVTQASTDNSIATTAYVTNASFSSLLIGINNWPQDQNFITQIATSSNSRMATTAFVDGMTFSMNGNTIGIHTVPTAATATTGGQIANLDYTIANKPNYGSFLNITNTWTGINTFPTASYGTSSRAVATTEFVNDAFIEVVATDNTWTDTVNLPVVGTTDSTRGATTASVPSFLSLFMPSMSAAPSIKLTGTCLTPTPTGPFGIDGRVANCEYVNTNVVNIIGNVGNGDGIEFTVNQRCPTRLTPSTYLANTTFVDGKITQYFSSAIRNAFKATSHIWSANNFFTYALSTLDNTTLGATCSYVTENFSRAKNYLGEITLNAQPLVKLPTYPVPAGQIGHSITYNATKTGIVNGFNTLINFGSPIEIGTYIFTAKEIVNCTGNTTALNAFNFFWGTSTASAELNFAQFTGSGAWTTAPNMVAWARRMNTGISTFHTTFVVSFVNASTLVHSVRATGTIPISSVQSIVTITRIA